MSATAMSAAAMAQRDRSGESERKVTNIVNIVCIVSCSSSVYNNYDTDND